MDETSRDPAPTSEDSRKGARRGARHGVSRLAALFAALGIALAVFVVDQGIKQLVESSIGVGESVPLVPGVVYLTHIKNTGGAFGILAGQSGLLLLGSAVAVGVVLWMLLAGAPSRLTTLGCGLILGGAAGNLLDRLTTGEVTDYVDLRVWPIFNAADTAITVGVAALLLGALLGPERPSRSR